MEGIAKKNRYYGDKGWESDLELFSEVAINSKQWLGTAEEHIYAAKLLLPSILQWEAYTDKLMGYVRTIPAFPVSFGIYFFHGALAIENSFKSVIAVRNRESIKAEALKNRKVPKLILGHNLVELAGAAKYEIDIDAEYMLAFLTRYGVWGGKYPFPTRNSEHDMTIQLSDGNHYVVGVNNPKTINVFVEYSEAIYLWSRAQVNKAMHPTCG